MEKIYPEEKDMMRAKNMFGKSIKQRSSEITRITNVEKMLRRGIALVLVNHIGQWEARNHLLTLNPTSEQVENYDFTIKEIQGGRF